jgi:uncharacterized protein YraI
MTRFSAIAIIVLALLLTACRGSSTPEQVPPQGDPAILLGEPDGQDDFRSDNNWTLFDSQCFKSEIDGGQYVMTSKGIQGMSCWEVSWPLLENFYIETEIQMPAACDQQDRFGLLFRAPDNNRGYLYGLNCAGQYSLSKWDGQQTTLLAGPTNNSAILSESNDRNRIGVVASGPDYYLHVNGEYLDQVEDSTFLEPGKIGYFVNAATQDGFTVKFDNLKVWVLEDEFYPTEASMPRFPRLSFRKPESNQPTVTATVNLNVRSGPGMQFPILGVAPQDTSGEVLGLSPDQSWYAVKVPVNVSGNETAWVSSSYVVLENPDNTTIPTIQPPLLPPSVNAPPPPAGAPAATMLETTTVRSGPGLEYPVYGISPTGAQAEIIGLSEDGDWWVIKLPTTTAPDGQGWVYAPYVSIANADNVPSIPSPELPQQITPAVPGTGAPAVITIEPINVRSGPGNAFPSYGTVPIGAIMAVVGISPDGEHWVVNLPTEIAVDNKGWVPARYVDAQNTQNVPVVQPPAAP